MDFYKDIDERTLSLVKYPPAKPPSVSYITDMDSPTNNLRGSLYQFAYYYVYDDGEKSVLSPYSKVAIPQNEEMLLGSFVSEKSINNKLKVEVKFDHFTIEKAVLCVRFSGDGEWKEFKEIKNVNTSEQKINYKDFIYSGVATYAKSSDIIANVTPIARFTTTIDNFQNGAKMENLELGNVLRLEVGPSYERYKLDAVLDKVSGNTLTLIPLKLIKDFLIFGSTEVSLDSISEGTIRVDVIKQTNRYVGFFSNTEVFTIMNSDRERPFDYVPLTAGAMEIGEKNRVFFGDVKEGFDPVDVEMDAGYNIEQFEVISDSIIYPYRTHLELNGSLNPIFYSLDGGILIAGYKQSFDLSNDRYSYGRVYDFFIKYETEVGFQNFIFSTDFIDISEISKELNKEDFYNYLAFRIEEKLGDFTINKAPTNNKIKLLVRYEPNNNALALYCEENLSFENFELQLISYDSSNNKIPTIKDKSTSFFGIAYYDEALRTNGVVGSAELKIPSLTEEEVNPPSTNKLVNGFNYFYRKYDFKNRIRASLDIKSKAPSWAKYYQILYGGDSKQIKVQMSGIKFSDIIRDGNYYKIPVNQVIDLYRENSKETNISNYVFEPGDRIRIHGQILNSSGSNYPNGFGDANASLIYSVVSPVYLYTEVDEIIAGTSYPDVDESYRKDYSTDQDYIFDSNGNKQRKESFLTVSIPNFSLHEKAEILRNRVLKRIDENTVFVFEIYRNKSSAIDNIYEETGIVGDIDEDGNHLGVESSDTDQSDSNPCSLSLDFYNSVNLIRYAPFTEVDDSTTFMPVYLNSDNVSDLYRSKIFYGRTLPKLENTEQARRRETIRWSGQFLTNTEINNINQFTFDGQLQLESKDGTISGLRNFGYIMKVVQPDRITSIYQGRQVLTSSDGSEDLKILKDSVVGTVYPSQQNYGSSIKGSIIAQDNLLYFLDDIRMRVCAASQGGIEPIDFGIRNFIDDLKNVFKYTHIMNCSFDERRQELIYSIQSSSENYTFAFYTPSRTWKTFYSYLPEEMISLGRYLFSFKNGSIWLHDDNELRNNFYGTQYDQEFEFIFNLDPNKMKLFDGIAIGTNKIWGSEQDGDIKIAGSDLYPNGMKSLLPAGRFKRHENLYVSEYLRDATTPNKTSPDSLINGRRLRGNAMLHKLRNSHTENVVLFNINLYLTPSEIS